MRRAPTDAELLCGGASDFETLYRRHQRVSRGLAAARRAMEEQA